MKKLRIILVLLEAPVPFGNAAARWYYVLLRELVTRGHQVTCFAACSKPSEIIEARRLFPPPDFDLRLYLFPERQGLRAKLATLQKPYSYMFSHQMKLDLELELAGKYDVLHLEQLWCGWLGLKNREKALINVHYLFSTDLAEATRSTFTSWLRHHLLAIRAERRLLRAYRHITTLSERLRDAITKIAVHSSVTVVPLGIDLSLYSYITDAQRPKAPVVSIIGSMDWYPTHSAAVRLMTRLWPEIKRQIPSAQVQFVGWNAKSALQEFADSPDVTITENVPDIRPYFQRTSVMLYAPARGSGMKIKILESLGFGVPVVTTAEGVEGLPAIDGIHAGICEDDAGLIERTVNLLQDPIAQNYQRAAGRALLELHCSPKSTVDAVEAIHADLAFRRE